MLRIICPGFAPRHNSATGFPVRSHHLPAYLRQRLTARHFSTAPLGELHHPIQTAPLYPRRSQEAGNAGTANRSDSSWEIFDVRFTHPAETPLPYVFPAW
jgi:hypothetical protein